MASLQPVLESLKEEFLALHERKEDLFWISKMGTADDADAAARRLAEAEIALNRFLQDPDRLKRLRDLEASPAGSTKDKRILRGWIATFAANVVETPGARALSEEIVGLEQALARKRTAMELGFVNPASGRFEPATSVRLVLMSRTDPDAARRRAAFEALYAIERYVLEHGFLDIVRKRNRLARTIGYEDYYDWRTSVVERTPKRAVFAVLDDLAARTRERAMTELVEFERQHGDGALDPWNFTFLRCGGSQRLLDPYFEFGTALRRWGRSFAALGISYRGATLTLDLLDRPGKYENGFMHGPGIGFFDGGRWRPARVNFTSTAIPGQLGSGLRAFETLFHEGGHAAHFSNILAPAPCFATEFAPTSIAYAETQSMFLDSLVDDADWRTAYARDAAGRPMPMEVIEADIRETVPFKGWEVRAWLTVPFAERALYEMDDDALQPEHVLETFRRIERDTQGLAAGVRPILAVPHLLSGESSAYYHGYILAEMAVYQTRAFLLKRDGHLADNPRVGPDLAAACWAPGNEIPFDETLRRLTGSPLRADALVEVSNQTVDEAIAEARRSVAAAAVRPARDGAVDLDATIRIVHGREVIADTATGGFEGACSRFESWIEGVLGEDSLRADGISGHARS